MLSLLVGVSGTAWAEAAAEAGAQDCRSAIAAVEPGSGLPAGLLGAIARVESGRRDPLSGLVEPWPWALNIAGEGRYPATRAEAVALVTVRRALGERSIDVGCMQINLLHHPHAFPDLHTAFEPLTNVRYAAAFLTELHRRAGGDWQRAIAWYHSATPDRGAAYAARVLAALGRLPEGGAVERSGLPVVAHRGRMDGSAAAGVLVVVPRSLVANAAPAAAGSGPAPPRPPVVGPPANTPLGPMRPFGRSGGMVVHTPGGR